MIRSSLRTADHPEIELWFKNVTRSESGYAESNITDTTHESIHPCTSACRPFDDGVEVMHRNRAARFIAEDRASPFGIWRMPRPFKAASDAYGGYMLARTYAS